MALLEEDRAALGWGSGDLGLSGEGGSVWGMDTGEAGQSVVVKWEDDSSCLIGGCRGGVDGLFRCGDRCSTKGLEPVRNSFGGAVEAGANTGEPNFKKLGPKV